MDVTNDESDVLLHKSSPELIADLRKSLIPFLWRNKQSGKKQIRAQVRVKEADRLVNLVNYQRSTT